MLSVHILGPLQNYPDEGEGQLLNQPFSTLTFNFNLMFLFLPPVVFVKTFIQQESRVRRRASSVCNSVVLGSLRGQIRMSKFTRVQVHEEAPHR